MKKRELIIIFAMTFLFIVLLGKYSYLESTKEVGLEKSKEIKKFIEYNFVECSEEQIKIKVSDGYLCRNQAEASRYLNIYDTYPRSNQGKEVIYDFLNEGNVEIAEDYLNNLYNVPRFDPVEIDPVTWEEDPYGERYWRFNYYSLRDTSNLLYAGSKTGNKKYNDKLIEIVESFIDEGMDKPYAWDDFHGVAFRTMVLTNTWWKLREQNVLPISTSTKILKALEIHGDFLSDRAHYQFQHNHGINEATALLVLSINFPDLSNSEEWTLLAEKRINEGIEHLIDNDGVFVENSPYYHFYVLEKYWEIFKYAKKYGIQLNVAFERKINKMISYGGYILQPNNQVPLLGASIDRKINLAEEYKEMTETNPYFLYVLTQGKQGEKPLELNKQYPAAGQAIMRSGWGKERNFEDETQIIFDIGPYRTTHSDLDALSFNLYSNGMNLLGDSGLYTYDKGVYQDYFKGTLAHNTIVVDGLDQKAKSPKIGAFLEENGFVYQSAQHSLYDGVSHERAILLIEHDLILIIDKLKSEEEHEYKQMFHLSPGMELKINEDESITGLGGEPNQAITISQLLKEETEFKSIIGSESPVGGWCSYEYGVLAPCYSLSYEKSGNNKMFITLLEIGEKDKSLLVEINENRDAIKIKKDGKEYSINISNSKKVEKEIIIQTDNFNQISSNESGVVIFFDDVHQSISYVTEIMKKHELSGNIAVIGKYINRNKNYLLLNELKELQNEDEWNLVSHSFYHQGAIEEYYDKNNLEGFREDILKMSQFLTENEINSAPNWYIYPKGQTNSEIQEIVGKYYKFARITKSPEGSNTFEDPLAIKAFSVRDTTTPEEVNREIFNAKKNNLTLFLTFHRIKLLPEEEVGYYIEDFRKIIGHINRQEIKVKTLSEFDKENGISFNNILVKNEIPEQLILDIMVEKNNHLS